MKRSGSWLLLAAAVSLAGCTGAGRPAALPEAEQVSYPLDTYVGNSGQVAEDGDYYYFATVYQTYALDKSDWHLEKVCRDSVCEHGGRCAYSAGISCLQGRKGQIYASTGSSSGNYFYKNAIYGLTGEWKMAYIFAVNPRIVMMEGWDGEELMYCWYEETSDQWGVNRFSLSERTDTPIRMGHIGGIETDEEWYYLWDTGRIWRIHKETGEEEELSGEYVSGMRLVGEELYYTAYDEGANRIDLKVMDKDGGEGRTVLECVTPQCFHIFKGKVLYTCYDLNNRENMNRLYSYDLATRESILLAEDVLDASLLPGDGKLLVYQQKKESEGIFSLINVDGSGLMELLTEPTRRVTY